MAILAIGSHIFGAKVDQPNADHHDLVEYED
jgi:hypothetical protein